LTLKRKKRKKGGSFSLIKRIRSGFGLVKIGGGREEGKMMFSERIRIY